MWIQKLSIHNFRNHPTFKAQFDSGIQLIYGENGAGKTNLIEALSLLTQAASFKTHTLYDAIKHDEKQFTLQAQYHIHDVENSVEISYLDKKKTIKQNKTTLNQGDWVGTIPFSTYLPSDMHELLSTPVYRRKFINLFICQKDPLYTKHLMYYTKVLRQRNAHLKSNSICNNTLEALTKQMQPSGTYLQQKRAQYTLELSEALTDIYQKISENRESVSLNYLRSNIEDNTLIQEQKQLDIRYKSTQIGPHRDDIQILLDNNLAQKIGSEGQKTSLILALKLAEQSLLQSIIAIDDFGAHLDKRRANTLINYLESLKTQVFITSTKDLELRAKKLELLCRNTHASLTA